MTEAEWHGSPVISPKNSDTEEEDDNIQCHLLSNLELKTSFMFPSLSDLNQQSVKSWTLAEIIRCYKLESIRRMGSEPESLTSKVVT